MKRLLISSIAALATLAAPSAFGQEPTSLFQSAFPLAPNPQLPMRPLFRTIEPTGTGLLSPWVASIPLRLSLQSGIFPMAGAFPNCASLEDASGNSFQGFPVQRYTFLPLMPNLALHGFSSAGCPIDSGVGGGFTYSIPIKPSIWLVAAGGAYVVPAHDTIPARRSADFRIDIMKATDGGRSLSVGIGRRGVSVGGSF